MKNVLILLVVALIGCKTEYIPIEKYYRDSLMIEKLIKDSVYVRDSIYVKEKGDTVYKYNDKYIYVYNLRIDTFYMEKYREVEVPVPVEKKLSWWQRFKLNYAGWLLGMSVGAVLVWYMKKWIVRRTRKE